MKNRAIRAAVAAMLSVCAATAGAQPTGSGFTYQGQLKTSGAPATGVFDMQFKLFAAQMGGMQIGNTVTVDDVNVAGGLFTAKVDFGVNALDGDQRWLEISVKANAAGSYTTLAPRQELTPAPYAVTAQKLDLPFNQAGASGIGIGTSGLFRVQQDAGGHAIVGQTNGSGAGIFGMSTTADGNAGRFLNSSGNSGVPALYVSNNGSGWGIFSTSSSGRAGSFEITNAASPHIALYGYTAGTGVGVEGYSIGSGKGVAGYNNGTGNAGYFRVGNAQNTADGVFIETMGSGRALSVRGIDGPAVYARSSGDGPALETDGGGLKVTGAGVNTNTWVYTHQTSAGNTSGTRTYLNNPHCNGKPSVIILVTNAFNGGGLFPRPVAVGYDSGVSRWYLHDMDNDEMSPNGARFNIMIVAP